MDAEDSLLLVLGARSGNLSTEELLGKMASNADVADVRVQLLDASKVFGAEHLEHAADRAGRAMRQGRNRASSILVEFVLYVSCRRQISEGLDRVGLRENTARVAVCVFGPRGVAVDATHLLNGTGLTIDDSVWASRDEIVKAFDIGAKELTSAGPDRWRELVLERIAMMDLVR